jgi:hypothetical protein
MSLRIAVACSLHGVIPNLVDGTEILITSYTHITTTNTLKSTGNFLKCFVMMELPKQKSQATSSLGPPQTSLKKIQHANHAGEWVRILQASLFYSIISIGIAGSLDTVRRMAIEVWFGKLCGVMVELPVLLAAFWRICIWTTRKFSIPPNPCPRLAMSFSAFLLLLCVQACFEITSMGLTPEEFFKNYVESFLTDFPANLLGRIVELTYAFMPLLQLSLEETKKKKM